jgi:small-conductance mechanosensitive channel
MRLIVIIFLILVVFSTGSLGETTVTASSVLFAFSFVFADTFRNVFNSYVFLFVRQPFDVGDRIHIGRQTDMPMFVRKMELLTTTFRRWDGFESTIPNVVLASEQIYNVRRSGPLVDEVNGATFPLTLLSAHSQTVASPFHFLLSSALLSY